MNKLISFVRLDFKTLKPYLTIKNLLIFAAIAIFLSAINGTVEMSLGIGFMLGTLFISYPFAIGEKSNMDALYTTLSVHRRTVVLGRYLFTFLLNICAIVFSFVFATFGVFGARLANVFQNGSGDSFTIILVLSALLVLIQTIQLPIFFKLGYTKAKFMSVLPFAIFMGCYSAFMRMTKDSGALVELSAFFERLLNNGILTAFLAILALVLITYISYSLSLSFYQKREF
ncbi:MAG: ABC-2 transporter permease [Peptococcaceae bacterium]|jgi:hypothetical protein|nr:ABC-2 transporter permease [Peptococcaceae bacterium]